MTHQQPVFDTSRAETLSRDIFGIVASAAPLPSERDQNFLLVANGAPALILKIANGGEDRAFLEAEIRAMRHVGERVTFTPRVHSTQRGDVLTEVAAPDGLVHLVWGVSPLPGVPLGTVRYRSTALFRRLGAAIGELTNAMRGFDDAALHRTFHWDLARGRDVVATHRHVIADVELRCLIDVLVAAFDDHTAALLPELRRGVIHGDLNDYNVLVGGGTDFFDRAQHVTGIIDFGDMVHGFVIGDLAIAIAYAVLDAPDPLLVMWEMVRGYHVVHPLTEAEMSAVFGLVVLRLCMSACLAAHQRAGNPGNAYLGVSQEPLRRILPRLARIPFPLAAATIRSACDLEPIASSEEVRRWLAARTPIFAPVLGIDLRTEPCLILDLSVAGAIVHGESSENEEPALTHRVFDAMHEASVRVAIGRYDEPRLLYVTPAFASGDGTLDEHRTIHIGLDLFAPAGTNVHAPLDGVVHFAEEHRVHLDYGGVVVLRHHTDAGIAFYTLYGHLRAASFAHLGIGQLVKAGECFATLGDPAENGGWTPHLHLQVITDMLGHGSNFPGVGTPGRRDVWRSISPDANLLVGVPAERLPVVAAPVSNTLARRREVIGGNVSVAYRRPIRIVRGWRQYLYDDEGHRFLDAYNNVPHVGHCHPRVVAAAVRQMSVLNTNTRYLHDGLEDYAERLVATLPHPLRVCFLVNSASEANELALRLARTYTQRRDLLVLGAAYHGNTTTLIDISPYKHEGPGGNGRPDWVHVAPLPDDYRGRYVRSDADAGARYASDVALQVAALAGDGRGLCGFIAESCPSVGGQILLPSGYLRGIYASVRAAAGVCIADEVQTGLGRLGTHFLGFEQQEVVPDIVVMGKPLGNGHPLAAVVTTRAIADAFDNGMEYFSTFGGNAVSCAVGLAVLDVLRDEGLQAHALRVGAHMLRDLRAMAERYPFVGDVRGSGLFLGIELVVDRDSKMPAPLHAEYVSNRMRDHRVLLGTDGPFHNVVKIRPPMPFNDDDGDHLIAVLDRVFMELAQRG